MKKLLFTIFLLIINFYSSSQDVISLKNGTKIEAKVVEINSTSIKFYKFEQLDGPIRILEKHEVSEIIYENGESEKFNVSPPLTNRPAQKEEANKIVKPVKDPILGKGFFIEGFFGVSQYSTLREDYYYYDINFEPVYESYKTNSTAASMGIRLGNKWYFTKSEKWRPGFQATWLRLGIHIIDGSIEGFLIGPRTLSIANIGMCNVFKFNEKLGMEANFAVGPTMNFDFDNVGFTSGYSFSIESKLRMNNLSIGLDYQYSDMNNSGVNGNNFNNKRAAQLHTLALTIGRKF